MRTKAEETKLPEEPESMRKVAGWLNTVPVSRSKEESEEVVLHTALGQWSSVGLVSVLAG